MLLGNELEPILEDDLEQFRPFIHAHRDQRKIRVDAITGDPVGESLEAESLRPVYIG